MQENNHTPAAKSRKSNIYMTLCFLEGVFREKLKNDFTELDMDNSQMKSGLRTKYLFIKTCPVNIYQWRAVWPYVWLM